MFFPFLSFILLVSAAAAAPDTLRSRQAQNLASNSNSTVGRKDGLVSAAWYTGWHSTTFPLSNVSWSKYSHMTYAFAITTPDSRGITLDPSDERLLPQFVANAHQNGVKASLSIGGWTGSRWFSSHVKTASNRTAFVRAVNSVAQQYDLDGLDFDWEYPGKQGVGCNVVDPDDTDNFLLFLQELRNSTTGRNLTLSAAVFIEPWIGSNGSPSTNLTAFSDVLDYIAIMNYDIRSNSSFGVGSSSPLDDSCAPDGARFGSAMSSVAAWTAAGIPANKLVLGVPAYGHGYVLSTNSSSSTSGAGGSGGPTMPPPYPPYNPSLTRKGDSWDSDGGPDVCGVMQGPLGVYTYWGLVQQGFLAENGGVRPGIEYRFDNCSQTPFLYDPTTNVYVSYDNPYSYSVKGGFIHSAGLKGFAMWEAGGDLNDALLNSILTASQSGGPVLPPKPTTGQATSASFAVPSHPLHSLFMWRALAFVLFSFCAWFA